MSSHSFCWSVLMLLFALFSSGGMDTVPIYACSMDSVQLFQNVSVAIRGPVILYRHGAKDTIIANWYMQASTLNYSVEPEYKGKVYLDEHGNIWMKYVQRTDEANYYIIYQTETLSTKMEAQIIVMVVPDSRCKPKIIRGVDTLITTPEPDVCGRPAAFAYWLQKPSITAEQNVIKLLPGQGAGTVYACIDSPAFRCAKNSKLSDYCTVFEDDSRTQSDVPVGSTMTTIILFCVLLMVIISMLIIIIQHKRLKNTLKRNRPLEHMSDETPLIAEEGISSHGVRSSSVDTGLDANCSSTTGNTG